MQKLLDYYYFRKKEIKERLKSFGRVWAKSDKKIFRELCFCICTPQSKAVNCERAVSELEKSGLLYEGGVRQVRAAMKGVRFPNNKARYIIEARRHFYQKGSCRIKKRIDVKDIISSRDWLVYNIKGIGLKEASHFLRNIGFGKNIAILDTHILRNLKRYKMIKEIPKSLSRERYLKIERKMRSFSKKIGIPIDELDLLLWAKETGIVFK